MGSHGQEPEDELIRFIEHFNEGDYEASHHELLAAWQRNISDNFYKGLIQLAGAYQHWMSGNAFWAEDLFASSYNLLGPFAPACDGIDVDALLVEIEKCHRIAREARESGETPPDPDLMPAIKIRRIP